MSVERVRYGREAAAALRRTISEAKGADPLEPVTVVVPTNHVGVAARRLLASGALGPLCEKGTGLAAVSFLTVYRLGELLGAARLSSDGRRPVSTPVIAAALRASLADDPGVFAPVAAHPSTEMALVAAYRELRDVSGAALEALASQSLRASDVVRLHHDARSRLEGSWYDEEDLLDAAVEQIHADGSVSDELGAFVLYLPERISRHGAALLREVAKESDFVVLAGKTGDEGADAEVLLSLGRLGAGAEVGAGDGADPLSVVDVDRTRIVTTSDADEEVRAAVRRVMDAVRDGTPLDRIAVLFATPDPYARLAFEQLSAAGIALNGSSVMPLSARVAGRTLLGLLKLAEGGFRREDLFAWLAGARIHVKGRWAPVSAWERLSREAGIVAGRDQWDRLLERLAEDLESRALEADSDPDAPLWRAERARADAERSKSLRAFALGLMDDLAKAAAEPRPWSEQSTWARRHLEVVLGGPTRRRDWPPPEERAAERVERALDRLACLEGVEGPVDLEVFTRTLELELEADLGRVGRMGEGVLVGPVSMGVGLDLDLIVVLGLAEGSFPASVRDDSLLPDRERQVVGDELPKSSGRVQRQHRDFLAALASAASQLLCVPRGDLRRNREQVPSRWVLEIAGRLSGERWWSEDLTGAGREEHAWLDNVESFDAGLRRLVLPATSQEFRLRFLLSQVTGRLDDAARAALGDPVVSLGAEVLSARRSGVFTRYDGNLAGVSVPSPSSRLTSATRLEGWASCPYAYLLHDLLGVNTVDNPEEMLTISALDQGSLVHEVLERFIAEVLSRPEAKQPPPVQAWSKSDRARLAEIAEEVCGDYEARGLTGRPIFWGRDKRRIIEDLLRVLDADEAHRAGHGTRPVAAELAFGLPGASLGPVALDIANGGCIEFRGKADRVDVGLDGTLHVVDYKTGGYSRYKGLSEEDPDLSGRKLQLPVYGQAARKLVGDPNAPVQAEYWFVTTKGEFKRVGYEVTDEVLAHVGETLRKIVDGVEAGVFPPYPTANSTSPWIECPYCDPDGLGVAELRRSWERKRQDPALTVFAGLVEPLSDEETDREEDD